MNTRTNLSYCYDGSFEGFLCCVFESYTKREVPTLIYPYDEPQCSLYPENQIQTDPAHAERVFASLVNKISEEACELVQLGFLTCLPQKELLLYRFIRMGYRHGAVVVNWLADETVHSLRKAVQFATHEAHLLCGFIRFSEQNGTLASIITPKNWVLPLLRDHFCSRYNTETFLIYDKTHQMALVHQPGKTEIFPLEQFSLEEADDTEAQFRRLWKRFYNTIGIEGRYNPKCRMTHMPNRYWENMTEFQNPGLPSEKAGSHSFAKATDAYLP